jgi:hypothetical protein
MEMLGSVEQEQSYFDWERDFFENGLDISDAWYRYKFWLG